jgi:hypothetical protein
MVSVDIAILHMTRNGIIMVKVSINIIWQDFTSNKFKSEEDKKIFSIFDGLFYKFILRTVQETSGFVTCEDLLEKSGLSAVLMDPHAISHWSCIRILCTMC